MSLTAVIFLFAFAAGCIFAFTRHPIYGLATYIATFFLSPPLRWWGQGLLYNVRWALIAAGVTILAIMVSKQLKRPIVSLGRYGIVWLLVAFTFWLLIQSAWALAPAEHAELLSYYLKFFMAVVFIYYCVDSEDSLRILLWTYVGGCFYFGWIAFTTYLGGRFEGFGGAGIGEANAGALTIVTGTLAAASLFLAGKTRDRVILLGVIPFILNGLVTTISRSGFLALAVGGLVYLFLAPKQYRGRIRMLSLLALILFGMLAGPSYWNRMQSLQHAGDQVQGVDTGNDRIELIKAQWRMFKGHPFGCGSTCTIVLSPKYLDEKFLGAAQSGADPTRMVRASHNTFMTMLVEHGIPGALFYLSMLLWIFKNVMSMSRVYSKQTGFLPMAFPAIGAAFAAITVGDMFVTYAKLEVRIWFLAILMAMIAIEAARVRQAKLQQQPASPAPSGALPPGLPAARGGFRPAAGG